jgi:hypothetical protein
MRNPISALSNNWCADVPLTACMRKIVIILNAMVKHNQPWNQFKTQVP